MNEIRIKIFNLIEIINKIHIIFIIKLIDLLKLINTFILVKIIILLVLFIINTYLRNIINILINFNFIIIFTSKILILIFEYFLKCFNL